MSGKKYINARADLLLLDRVFTLPFATILKIRFRHLGKEKSLNFDVAADTDLQKFIFDVINPFHPPFTLITGSNYTCSFFYAADPDFYSPNMPYLARHDMKSGLTMVYNSDISANQFVATF